MTLSEHIFKSRIIRARDILSPNFSRDLQLKKEFYDLLDAYIPIYRFIEFEEIDDRGDSWALACLFSAWEVVETPEDVAELIEEKCELISYYSPNPLSRDVIRRGLEAFTRFKSFFEARVPHFGPFVYDLIEAIELVIFLQFVDVYSLDKCQKDFLVTLEEAVNQIQEKLSIFNLFDLLKEPAEEVHRKAEMARERRRFIGKISGRKSAYNPNQEKFKDLIPYCEKQGWEKVNTSTNFAQGFLGYLARQGKQGKIPSERTVIRRINFLLKQRKEQRKK